MISVKLMSYAVVQAFSEGGTPPTLRHFEKGVENKTMETE